MYFPTLSREWKVVADISGPARQHFGPVWPNKFFFSQPKHRNSYITTNHRKSIPKKQFYPMAVPHITKQGSAIAERHTQRSVSAEILAYCCTNTVRRFFWGMAPFPCDS